MGNIDDFEGFLELKLIYYSVIILWGKVLR